MECRLNPTIFPNINHSDVHRKIHDFENQKFSDLDTSVVRLIRSYYMLPDLQPNMLRTL